MKFFLFIVAILAFLFGLGVMVGSKSAVHEIEAMILFLISTVSMGCAGIIESVNRLRIDVLATQASEKV